MDKSYKDPDFEITNDDCVTVCLTLWQNSWVAIVGCQTLHDLQPKHKLYRTWIEISGVVLEPIISQTHFDAIKM